MSDTPIRMENDGYGDVPSKHPFPDLVYKRNEHVDGAIGRDALPVIATTRKGVVDGVNTGADNRLRCALANFFGTDDEGCWKGYPLAEENCALICRPLVGQKTLQHCKTEDKVNDKPVYYYWKRRDGRPVLDMMVDKEYDSYKFATVMEDYCCDFEIDQCVADWYSGSIRESIYDTNRPSDMGFCFCGCWLIRNAPGESILSGERVNWYTGALIASGTEPAGDLYFYAVAEQKYIIDSNGGVDYTDETGCYRGVYLSALTTMGNWGTPYLYLGNGEFEDHKDMLERLLDGWDNVDVYEHLIDSAISKGTMPGLYKDKDGRVVFVQTCSYHAEVYLRDLTGCSDFGYVSYGEDVEVDHASRVIPSQDKGKFDKNPKASYSEWPTTGGESFLPYLTYWVNIHHTDGESPGGDVNWEREMQFTVDEPLVNMFRQSPPPYSNEFVAVPFTEKKQSDGKYLITFKIDPSSYYKVGCTRVKLTVSGQHGNISLNREWTSWEPFPSSSPAYDYDPPKRV